MRLTKKFFQTLYRTLEAASEKYNQKESSYIDDIQKLEDNLADVILTLIIFQKKGSNMSNNFQEWGNFSVQKKRTQSYLE